MAFSNFATVAVANGELSEGELNKDKVRYGGTDYRYHMDKPSSPVKRPPSTFMKQRQLRVDTSKQLNFRNTKKSSNGNFSPLTPSRAAAIRFGKAVG